jgi:3-deoxy-7-phosphoheptulonate synthase
MPLENINIDRFEPLIAPKTIKSELPINAKAAETVARARESARNILRGTDKRLLVISGPCSIHDADLALEYAGRLAKLAVKYEDQMVVLMRVYMDKPRTTVGWRGFQNDPDMDFTNNFLGGLRRTRDLLIQINANHKHTGRWRADCQCRLVSRTAPTVMRKWRPTRFKPRAVLTFF